MGVLITLQAAKIRAPKQEGKSHKSSIYGAEASSANRLLYLVNSQCWMKLLRKQSQESCGHVSYNVQAPRCSKLTSRSSFAIQMRRSLIA